MVVKRKWENLCEATSESTLQFSILMITAILVKGNNEMEETSKTKTQGMYISLLGLP